MIVAAKAATDSDGDVCRPALGMALVLAKRKPDLKGDAEVLLNQACQRSEEFIRNEAQRLLKELEAVRK